MDRAVIGLAGFAIHLAKARRRPSRASGIWNASPFAAPSTGTPRALNTPGVTLSPGASSAPPPRMRLSGRHCCWRGSCAACAHSKSSAPARYGRLRRQADADPVGAANPFVIPSVRPAPRTTTRVPRQRLNGRSPRLSSPYRSPPSRRIAAAVGARCCRCGRAGEHRRPAFHGAGDFRKKRRWPFGVAAAPPRHALQWHARSNL